MYLLCFITLFSLPVIYFIIRLLVKITSVQCKSQVCLMGKTAIVTGGNQGEYLQYFSAWNANMFTTGMVIKILGWYCKKKHYKAIFKYICFWYSSFNTIATAI